MVFFTCNTCGASLKKNQVEKHYQNECRDCEVLSCMDCGRDFYGEEYMCHTKCISEAEKYQGSSYNHAASKGDKKQDEWIERAQLAIQSSKVKPKLVPLLTRLSNFSNIPRKKKKFENFVQNSFSIRNQRTKDELWEILSKEPSTEEETAKTTPAEVKDHTEKKGAGASSVAVAQEEAKKVENCEQRTQEGVDSCEASKSKKKRKKEHILEEGPKEEEVSEDLQEKPKKRRKKEEVSDQEESRKEQVSEEDLKEGARKSKKKKKKKSRSDEIVNRTSEGTTAEGEAVEHNASRESKEEAVEPKKKKKREEAVEHNAEEEAVEPKKKKKKKESFGEDSHEVAEKQLGKSKKLISVEEKDEISLETGQRRIPSESDSLADPPHAHNNMKKKHKKQKMKK